MKGTKSMKKLTVGICCLTLIALIVTAYAATNKVQNPSSADTLNPSDVSLAVDLSIDEMASQSDLIAIGNCVEARSVWVDRSLVTLAEISVQEVLKGDSSPLVTVVLPGGVDANRKFPIAMTYPGAPRIAPSEKVFLFLNRDDVVADGYTIAGFSQGKFSVLESENGQEFVSRDLTHTALKGRDGVQRGRVNQTSLSSLKAQVLRQLRKQ